VDTLGNKVVVSEFDAACPQCGADSCVFDIRVNIFNPIVAVCKDCGHAWVIIRGTHAFKHFEKVKKEREA
jgi:transposase-like protein